MKKKVCIITTAHQPFDTRIFHKEALTLKNAGFEVILIAQHERSEVVDGIIILPLTKPANRLDRIFGLTWQALELAKKQKADIYHFHDPELLLVGFLLARFSQAHVIYDVHENYTEVIKSRTWIPKFIRKFLSGVMGNLESFFSKRMDGIITVTEDLQKRFIHQNSVIIKNYPEVSFASNSTAKTDNHSRSAEYHLIYIGDLTRVRGIVEIIKSLEFVVENHNIKLLIIGDFSDVSLQSELEMLEANSYVDYLGRKPYSEITTYLSTADIGLVCLHPLERYKVALPVKMFEYMAAGVPVIASNFPLWKSILEENQCGLLVNPEDPVEIGEAISYLIEHPDIRENMGRNGKKCVKEKYNWQTEEEKLLRFYEEMISV